MRACLQEDFDAQPLAPFLELCPQLEEVTVTEDIPLCSLLRLCMNGPPASMRRVRLRAVHLGHEGFQGQTHWVMDRLALCKHWTWEVQELHVPEPASLLAPLEGSAFARGVRQVLVAAGDPERLQRECLLLGELFPCVGAIKFTSCPSLSTRFFDAVHTGCLVQGRMQALRCMVFSVHHGRDGQHVICEDPSQAAAFCARCASTHGPMEIKFVPTWNCSWDRWGGEARAAQAADCASLEALCMAACKGMVQVSCEAAFLPPPVFERLRDLNLASLAWM